MKKHHLMPIAVSALGFLALNWAGGPTGSIIRVGPLEWSFDSAPEPAAAESLPLVGLQDRSERVS